jgi:hypothetical protein
VTGFFASYREECQPSIRGVIHAVAHALVTDATEQHFRNLFRSKVDGLELASGLPTHALGFLPAVFLGLLVSLPQMGAYAAANAFLDGLAACRESMGWECPV